MSNFDKLRDLVMSFEDDFSKFYDKQNAAAGMRLRKGMQQLKTMAQAFRTEVQNTKNAGAAAAPKAAVAGSAKKAAPAAKKAASAATKKAAPAKKKYSRGTGAR